MLRIIWRAGCRETCTSGSGLGAACLIPVWRGHGRRLHMGRSSVDDRPAGQSSRLSDICQLRPACGRSASQGIALMALMDRLRNN